MNHKLIVSLDKLTSEEVLEKIGIISQALPEYKDNIVYKFNDLIALIGLKWLTDLLENLDIRVMLDGKWNDIPNTIRNYITQLERSGLGKKVDIITVHANGGQAMLEEAITTRDELGLKFEVFAISALTTLDDSDTQIIYDETPEHSVLKLTKLALETWVDGMVCSGQETAMLREIFSDYDFKILNPGVRFAGGDTHDQKRVVTPELAATNGVDYVVMGRPILQSPDMAAAVKQFFDEISGTTYTAQQNYEFEKILYTGDWKEILSYIGAFYFRPEWGKYCRFTSSLVSNAYINIWAVERHYPVIERATNEMAAQIRSANMEPDIIIWAEMGSIRISLYLAEKLGVEESIYTEKDKFDMSDEQKIDGASYYRKFWNADVTIWLKRHARDLKWKKIIIWEDVVSRWATIKKMIKLIKGLWWEVIAIACIGNRYEQDNQDGIPIISCFIPPKFEVYWDVKTREDVRWAFPQLPERAVVSEKPKNEWGELVESMRK